MVEKYRKVLEREIDVLKLIGKRGLSYRGKHNEESSSFGVENLDRGNFLEILFLLSKYDAILKEHIDECKTRKSNSKGRGNHLTLMSKTTINSILSIMAEMIHFSYR
jgi:hypothetical protein